MYSLIYALENVFKSISQISEFKNLHPDSNPQYINESLVQLENAARGLTVAITDVAEGIDKRKDGDPNE